MANRVRRTEHAGAKNGGGHWGRRAEAKTGSKKRRRQDDRRAAGEAEMDEKTRHALPEGAAGRLFALKDAIDKVQPLEWCRTACTCNLGGLIIAGELKPLPCWSCRARALLHRVGSRTMGATPRRHRSSTSGGRTEDRMMTTIYDTTATPSGLIERHAVRPGDPAQHHDAEEAKRVAIASARNQSAHVHREEDEHGPAWCYVVCDDPACQKEGT